MANKSGNIKVPEIMQPRYEEIVSLIDTFCREKLNSEYQDLCHELAAALARKRPSPLNSRQAKSWACGIVYTIGFVNFLFDKSQTPHVCADELCAWFSLAANTGGNISRQIRDMLRIDQLDVKWMIPSIADIHPMTWLIMVNGFVVDARSAPRHIQEEAFRKGLIPYLPEIPFPEV